MFHYFFSVIHALSLCREQGSAEKAEELLIYMEDEYRNGNVKVKPNTHTFTRLVYNSYAQSTDSSFLLLQNI